MVDILPAWNDHQTLGNGITELEMTRPEATMTIEKDNLRYHVATREEAIRIEIAKITDRLAMIVEAEAEVLEEIDHRFLGARLVGR